MDRYRIFYYLTKQIINIKRINIESNALIFFFYLNLDSFTIFINKKKLLFKLDCKFFKSLISSVIILALPKFYS